MPPRRTQFNPDHYARLRRGSELMDFTEWNEWYAGYLADNLFLRSNDAYGAHLAGADLRFAQLQGADLSYSYLKHANLANANLAGTNLWLAFFAGAELSGANPDAAVYDPADKIKFDPIQASRLRQAAESGDISAWNEWYKTELSGKDGDVRLYGAYLEEASLCNLDLSGAVLCYAHLEGADLTAVDLRHAELGGSNLAGAKKERTLF